MRRASWVGADPVSRLGESALLDLFTGQAATRAAKKLVRVGPGDDAGAFRPSGLQLASADTLVEDVDFRRIYQSPYQVGWKAWRAAVSDLAAMGARARAGLASLLLPGDTSVLALRALQLGLVEAAEEDGAVILGGDVSRTEGPLAVAVTVLGEVKDGEPVELGGGAPGDALLVTGRLGEAAAALGQLEAAELEPTPGWVRRLVQPGSRLGAGERLRRLGASAMTDLSDGLLLDGERLGRASQCGVELWLDRVPLGAGLEPTSEGLRLALSGGEDFELLAAVPEPLVAPLLGSWEESLGALSVIGKLTAEPGLELLSGPGGERLTLPGGHGFRHF